MSSSKVKSVLLAGRHHGLSEGMRGLLETAFEAVVMVADASSLLESAERLQPAVAVVELALCREDGFGLLRTLRARCPHVKLIVIGTQDEPSVVRSVMQTGVEGYVVKSAIANDLLLAIETVLAGGTYLPAGSRDGERGHLPEDRDRK